MESESSYDCLILDACCIINLVASGYMPEILRSVPSKMAVAEYVHEVETLRVYDGPEDDVRRSAKRIELQPLIEDGLLMVVSLDSEAEKIIFINLAAELDDGEAYTGAIASHRGWAIATDDRKATALLTRYFPRLQIVSTPEILKHWADSNSPPREVLRAAIRNIRLRGDFDVGPHHPLYAWWQSHGAQLTQSAVGPFLPLPPLLPAW